MLNCFTCLGKHSKTLVGWHVNMRITNNSIFLEEMWLLSCKFEIHYINSLCLVHKNVCSHTGRNELQDIAGWINYGWVTDVTLRFRAQGLYSVATIFWILLPAELLVRPCIPFYLALYRGNQMTLLTLSFLWSLQ